MKADPADLERLLKIQELDTGIEHIKHKAGTLPVHAVVETLMKRRAETADDLVAASTNLSDSVAAADKAEADVIPVRERLARNQARVDAGQVDAKALSSALDEIAHLKQRISDLEDAELFALDAVDAAKARKGELTALQAETEAALREAVTERDGVVAGLVAEAKALAAERGTLTSQVAGELMALYEKIRARANGVGVARLEGGRCLGCGLEATVADLNGYLAADGDAVLRCAECDRILVR